MLWWHVGGWSRLLDKPFAELDLGLAAVLAGVDMADMSRSAAGPAATPAILQGLLRQAARPRPRRSPSRTSSRPFPGTSSIN